MTWPGGAIELGELQELDHQIVHTRRRGVDLFESSRGFARQLGALRLVNPAHPRTDVPNRCPEIVGGDARELAEGLVAPLELGPRCFQLRDHALQLSLLTPQFEEDTHLAQQNMPDDRLGEEVHSAALVSAKCLARIACSGSHEDDRYPLGTFVEAQDLGGLEAVHLRHLHVQKYDRDVGASQRDFDGELT